MQSWQKCHTQHLVPGVLRETPYRPQICLQLHHSGRGWVTSLPMNDKYRGKRRNLIKWHIRRARIPAVTKIQPSGPSKPFCVFQRGTQEKHRSAQFVIAGAQTLKSPVGCLFLFERKRDRRKRHRWDMCGIHVAAGCRWLSLSPIQCVCTVSLKY